MSLVAADRLPPLWEMHMDGRTTHSVTSSLGSSSPLASWLAKNIRTTVLASFAPQATPNASSSSSSALITTLYQNLLRALQALHVVEVPVPHDAEDDDDNDDNDDDDNNNNINTTKDDETYDRDPKSRRNAHIQNRKRKRKALVRRLLLDRHKIWFQAAAISSSETGSSKTLLVEEETTTTTTTAQGDERGELWDDSQDDIPDTVGGKLAVVSVGGLLNGLSGHYICHASNANPKLLLKQAVLSGLATTLAQTLHGMTVLQLHAVATALHVAIADQVKLDILRTTPQRVQMLLAADLTSAEFQGIRRRVYETVILGRGTMHPGHTADDASTLDLPTAASGAVHDIEKFKKCTICGNNNQAEFILDRKNGDLICANCGAVVSESIMHEGSQFRKFEGEVDRNHHGDAANPLYSNAHNMGTSLSGVAPTTGAGIGGWGSKGGGSGGGGSRNLETILKNAHAYTELNVCQFGKTDRRTRIGYKDRQKKDAFIQMTHAGDALNLHEAVVQRAKELFAGFRDDRELIQQFKGVLAACLCEAFEQLSAEGKHLLRQQQQMQDQQEKQYALATSTTVDGKPKAVSARASRRSDLHHATLAGKGGLLLNKDPLAMDTATTAISNNAASANGGVDTNTDESNGSDVNNGKPAAAWDLEDCRTWLLEASRTIAQWWVEERKNNTAASKQIPSGPLGELEGQLVEHAIRLCEHLEAELQTRATSLDGNNTNHRAQQRVVTPRLSDMTKLGIKWQHAHERGSGGRGGVGGSGNGVTGSATAKNGGRTAGQILLLKTAKKLGAILNDPVAGDAIHRELRSVIGKQQALKQEEMRKEATRQRLNQMQRKPWLAARVQQ